MIRSFSGIVASYGSFWATKIANAYAEYALTRTYNGVAQVYLVYFVRDGNGIWRLDSM
jgi:hypothetical protein